MMSTPLGEPIESGREPVQPPALSSLTAPRPLGETTRLDSPAPLGTLDREHRINHLNTIFSVSSGMVGVCLTGIGLVKVVTQSAALDTICDELIVLDAMLFSLAALLSYRALHLLIRGRGHIPGPVVDSVFFLGLCLMVLICGVFAWSVI